MIYYNDTYYEDIQGLLEVLMDYIPNPSFQQIADVFPGGLTIIECKEIKIKQFDVNNIVDAMYDSIDEDLWPEDTEYQQVVTDILKEFSYSIGLGKIEILNAKMPTVWMPTKEKIHYSLEELERMLS